jgi:hypothetical protein
MEGYFHTDISGKLIVLICKGQEVRVLSIGAGLLVDNWTQAVFWGGKGKGWVHKHCGITFN